MPKEENAKYEISFFEREAGLILERLVAEGRVTAKDIDGARRSLSAEADDLQRRIDELRAISHAGSGSSRRAASRGASKQKPRVRRRRRPTRSAAERKQVQALQGKYLGFMHKIPKKELMKFKGLIPSKGKAAVVEMMEQYVRSHSTSGSAKPGKGRRFKNANSKRDTAATPRP